MPRDLNQMTWLHLHPNKWDDDDEHRGAPLTCTNLLCVSLASTLWNTIRHASPWHMCLAKNTHTYTTKRSAPDIAKRSALVAVHLTTYFIGNQCLPCIERSDWPSSHDDIWPTWIKGQSMNHNEVTPSRFMPKSVNGHSWQDDLQWNKTYQDLTSCRQNRTDSKRANWFQNVSFNNRKLQQSDYKCFFLILITNDHG